MNYLQRKKLAFMSIVNKVKGCIRSISGVPPLALEDCVDEDSLIDYKIYGDSVQNGTPTPETPVEVQSVGEKTVNLFDISKIETSSGLTNNNDGTITVKVYGATSGASVTLKTLCPDLKVGDTVCLSFESIKTVKTIYLYDIKTYWYSGNSKVITQEMLDSRVFWYCERIDDVNYDLIISNIQIQLGTTATPYEPYNKYKIPVTARGKNLLPNSNWMSGTHSNGFNEVAESNYITEYTPNSISFNLTAWKGVSSPRFPKDSVKRIVFKINQNQINSDEYINFYINIQGYDDENNNIGNQSIYNNVISDSEYVFDLDSIKSYSFFQKSTQLSFCILNRKNNIDNLMIYDIAYYADTDTTVYEPYHAPIQTNIYLDEPLRSQYHSREKQWYYDKVDYKTGTIIRNLAEKTFVGAADENWMRKIDESDTKICFFIRDISNNTSFAPDNVMCDKFIANYTYASNVNTDLEGVSLAFTTDMFYIGILKSRLTDAGLTVDLDGFKTWLSQNPVTITYILKEPTEETISIPKLPTIKGTTIYEIGTSLNASNMETTYHSTSKGG